MSHTPYKKYKVTRKNYVQKVTEDSPIELLEYTFSCKPGESFPFVGLPPTCEIYNVMGQEDLFRKEAGIRVLNFGDARIVFTTGVPTEARILYSANTEDLNIDTGILNPGSPKLYHEWFLPDLNVDSLYAFKIIATAKNVTEEDEWEELCPDPIESGTYFFTIGGIVSQPNFNFTLTPTFFSIVVEELEVIFTFSSEIEFPNNEFIGELQVLPTRIPNILYSPVIETIVDQGYLYDDSNLTIV